MEIDLAGNSVPTFNLSLLHGGFRALSTIGVTQIPLTLAQHIHGLIARGVEPVAANDAVFQHRKRSVPPLLKPTSGHVCCPTGLVEQLHARNLSKPRNLIENVAAKELDSRGYGFPTQAFSQLGQFAHTGVAFGIAEVPSALEETRNGGLATTGGGLGEPGLGGL